MGGGVSPEAAKKPVNTVKNYVLKQLPKLMTTCIIMRIEDFTLYRVTTSGKKQALKEFISGKFIINSHILLLKLRFIPFIKYVAQHKKRDRNAGILYILLLLVNKFLEYVLQ